MALRLGRNSITRLYQNGQMREPFTIRGTNKLQRLESEIWLFRDSITYLRRKKDMVTLRQGDIEV